MSPTLRDELERSFGEGPPAPPVGTHLEAGRRALRRRRVATGALGLVLVAGLGYAVSGPGSSPRSTGDVATDPTSTPTTAPSDPAPPESAPSAADAGWERGEAVRYRDGALEIRPGVVVHERIENPYGYAPPKDSTALDLTFQGTRTWSIIEHTRDGVSYTTTLPSNGWASFADWVADQAGLSVPGDDGWPVTLRLDDQGAVVASAGSEVLQRTDDPQLGDTFAGPGVPTGAAVVRAADGQSYFVVWRVVGGELDVITTPPADVVGATFQELLTYARAQYASGEGLR
jgi:hypothetical protein